MAAKPKLPQGGYSVTTRYGPIALPLHLVALLAQVVCVAVAENKAHTAAVRRIARRYGAAPPNGKPGDSPDVVAGDMKIEVETSATLSAGIARLLTLTGPRFIAVTNKESLAEALALTADTGIGVMDGQGEIVRPAAEV